MTAFKTVIFLLVVPGIVLFYVPYQIVTSTSDVSSPHFRVLRYVAVIPLLVGVATLLWCAWDFTFKGQGTPAPIDPPEELVIQGLYRFVRNPMYVGALLILVGHFLWFQSLWLLLYAGCLFLAFHLFVVLYEEPTLRRQFGESYIRYCQSVSRWIPRIRFLFTFLALEPLLVEMRG